MGHQNLSDPDHFSDPPEQINQDIKDAMFTHLTILRETILKELPNSLLRFQLLRSLEGAMSFKSMVRMDGFSHSAACEDISERE